MEHLIQLETLAHLLGVNLESGESQNAERHRFQRPQTRLGFLILHENLTVCDLPSIGLVRQGSRKRKSRRFSRRYFSMEHQPGNLGKDESGLLRGGTC